MDLGEMYHMLDGKEELGAENEKIIRQLRDAEILMPLPGQFKYKPQQLKPMEPGEWEPGMKIPDISEDINALPNAANARQVGGAHYKSKDIQPWGIIDQGPREQAIGFYRYNALKYVMRAGDKDPFKQDIAKAHHYLEKLLEILE